MALKLAAFFLTLLTNIVVCVMIFFFMLLAMNGYSESDATWGIGGYIALALLVSLTMSAGAIVLMQILTKRQFRGFAAASIAVPLFSIAGAGLNIVCSIIGVLIAEYVRVNY